MTNDCDESVLPAPDETDTPGDAMLIHAIGHPRSQPRPRFTGGHVVSTVSLKASLWRAAVVRAGRAALRARGDLGPLDSSGGVEVKIWFGFPAKDKARMGQPHTAKPDADNLAKLVLDALVEAGALGGDDARAARLAVVKQWTIDRPGAIILIHPLKRERDNRPATGLGPAPAWLSKTVA